MRSLAFTLALGTALQACTSFRQMPRGPEPAGLRGTFAGTDAAGERVSITFAQHANEVVGEGRVGDRPVALSGALGWHGEAVVARDDGTTVPVTVELSPSGTAATITGLGDELSLHLEDAGARTRGGPLSGVYRAEEPAPAEMRLSQTGELLAGHGSFAGRRVALAGRMLDATKGRATLLFDDGSRMRVSLVRQGEGLEVSAFLLRFVLQRAPQEAAR
jgi:hypothetical protein